MIGFTFTLSPEQIRQAPPEVRRWIERQIAEALDDGRPPPSLQATGRHLVACSLDEARAILTMLQGMPPVVGVFFELGREPAAASGQGLRALRLDEMLLHSRLPGPDQLVQCLQAIDEAVQRIREDPAAALTALDDRGHCLVTDATAASILALWKEIVTAHSAARPVGQSTTLQHDAGAVPQYQVHYSMPGAPFGMAPPPVAPVQESGA